MIEIGIKRSKQAKTRITDPLTGAKKVVPKLENGQPVITIVANEPVRVTRGALNGRFCRDSGRRLVVKLRDGDLLELRPQGCRKGTYVAHLFDVYSWMIRSNADQIKMAKLREIKAKRLEARQNRRFRRPI